MDKNKPACKGALFTKKEAAAYLGISPRTLDDWRTAKAIACIERPGFVRFLPSDLEAFLERHRRPERSVTKFRPRLRNGHIADMHPPHEL
jgi:hypothetical protein